MIKRSRLVGSPLMADACLLCVDWVARLANFFAQFLRRSFSPHTIHPITWLLLWLYGCMGSLAPELS